MVHKPKYTQRYWKSGLEWRGSFGWMPKREIFGSFQIRTSRLLQSHALASSFFVGKGKSLRAPIPPLISTGFVNALREKQAAHLCSTKSISSLWNPFNLLTVCLNQLLISFFLDPSISSLVCTYLDFDFNRKHIDKQHVIPLVSFDQLVSTSFKLVAHVVQKMWATCRNKQLML